MKDIKEYIKEDANKEYLRFQIDLWLRQNGVIKFMEKMIPKKIPIKFTVRNNIAYPTKLSIEIKEHVPSYIQFDKQYILKLLKNNQYQYIGSSGEIIEQSDVDRLGCITTIRNVRYVKDLNIDTYDSMTFDNISQYLDYPTVNFHKKSGTVELKLINMSYREILHVNINSKASIKLVLEVLGSSYSSLVDQLNNDKVVTDHIINKLHITGVYDKDGDHIIFTDPSNIENGKWIRI